MLLLSYIVTLYAMPDQFKVMISKEELNIPGVIISVVVTLALIEFCKKIKSAKLLEFMGRNSIGFYLMSGALPIVISIFLHKIIPGRTFLGLLICFFISVGVSVPAVWILNKWFPFMLDFRKLMKG